MPCLPVSLAMGAATDPQKLACLQDGCGGMSASLTLCPPPAACCLPHRVAVALVCSAMPRHQAHLRAHKKKGAYRLKCRTHARVMATCLQRSQRKRQPLGAAGVLMRRVDRYDNASPLLPRLPSGLPASVPTCTHVARQVAASSHGKHVELWV